MITSPMYFSIVPPWRSRTGFIAEKYSVSTSRKASLSSRPASSAEPFRLQKTTVTVLRTSGEGARAARTEPQ